MSSNLTDWLALYLTPGLGIKTWHKLRSAFDQPDRIFTASATELRKMVPWLSAKIINSINKEKLRQQAQIELDRADKTETKIISINCRGYPELLQHIHEPPPFLYIKGDPDLLNSNCLGIVGARASTTYGQRVAHSMAKQLSSLGLTITSGMALGIDAAAHKGALEAGGSTIAVLGCGLDVIYPRQNNKLYHQIAKEGAVVSEYPFGTQPEPFRFPARNRIISGLSLGLLVVEAARKSGSLITAHLAMEQGREVFAVPGQVDSFKSEGTHGLLKNGAKLVHTVDDILEELAPMVHWQENEQDQEKRKAPELNQEEQALFNCLDTYPQNIDSLMEKSGLAADTVQQVLLTLELKNLIISLPGSQYQLK